MNHIEQTAADGDRHLRPLGYYALAAMSGVIGLCASYVTINIFAMAIQVTEPDGAAREMLQSTATLFVSAELAAAALAGLLPVRRLRALRLQLISCAMALVAFEGFSLYGARVLLIKTSEARATANLVETEQLRASIDANRRSAAALLDAGQHSSQSVIAASRADGARSIRDAAALEAESRLLAAKLAQAQAARKPSSSEIFGQSGVIALAVVQSMLMSCIGLLFVGTAGALARAARDASATDVTAGAAPKQVDAAQAAESSPALRPSPVSMHHSHPIGAIPATSWSRYALAAGAGLATLGGAPDKSEARSVVIDSVTAKDAESNAQMQSIDDADTDAPAQEDALSDSPTSPTATASDAVQIDASSDAERFRRVRSGIESGHIRPSLRSIYASSGASQQVAARYLSELERSGVIERSGRGYAVCANVVQTEV